MDFMDPSSVHDLANIREQLVRMEDTIIFNLIERSDFPHSPSVYSLNAFPIPDHDGSFLDWIFKQHEKIQSQVRRFQSPDQYPFYPEVILPSFLPKINYPKLLAKYFREVNVNKEIMRMYIEEMVPKIARDSGDQAENIGSTAMTDIEVLQSLSRRIHFGMFVAEAKFLNETERFTEMIKNKDIIAIEKAITNEKVEEMILQRLIEKGKAYGTDPTVKIEHAQSKVKPEVIVKIYKDYVIPLTKKVEVEYLLRRLEDED